MAEINTATSSGAKLNSDLRRRNVADTGKHQVQGSYTTEDDDVKKTRPGQVSYGPVRYT